MFESCNARGPRRHQRRAADTREMSRRMDGSRDARLCRRRSSPNQHSNQHSTLHMATTIADLPLPAPQPPHSARSQTTRAWPGGEKWARRGRGVALTLALAGASRAKYIKTPLGRNLLWGQFPLFPHPSITHLALSALLLLSLCPRTLVVLSKSSLVETCTVQQPTLRPSLSHTHSSPTIFLVIVSLW